MNAENLKVLFVDDQIDLLNGLRRMLRQKRKDWSFQFCDHGEKGLEILENFPADIVVSDFMMPGMNGGQFLKEVRRKFPGTIRFILSGHVDLRTFLDSISSFHQFLSKPCDGMRLIEILERTCILSRQIKNGDLRREVCKINSLPMLPSVFSQLKREFQSGNSSLENLSALVFKDIGMSLKLLQVAHSPFFGFKKFVSDPVHATQVLGQDLVEVLVSTSGLFDAISEDKFDPEFHLRLWEHSLNTGVLAQRFAVFQGQDKNLCDQALFIGLYHDIGKVALYEIIPDQYREIIRYSRENHIPLNEAEMKFLNTSHAEIGGCLLCLWGFPSELVDGVLKVNEPGPDFEQIAKPHEFAHYANLLEKKYNGNGDTVGYFISSHSDRERLNGNRKFDDFRIMAKELVEIKTFDESLSK